MAPPPLSALAAAITGCDAANADQLADVRQALADAVADASHGEMAGDAEALLACVLESLAAAGERGKALLDDLGLEVLPMLASLAPQSDACCSHLASLASLTATACAPRDTVTAFLEVLDTLLADSHGAATLQFLCNLMALLPGVLGQLTRRRAAFARECCAPVAALSQAHGEVLAAWSLAQLSQAAQQGGAAGDAMLRRLDTFLAANWQAYADFVADVLTKVLPQEPGADARSSTQQALALLVLQLLHHLTAIWPPPGLQPLAMQLLSHPAAAQHLPSAHSVAPPTAMLAALHAQQQAPAATEPPAIPSNRLHAQAAAAAARQEHSTTQQAQQDSDGAAQVVRNLLCLLRQAGCTTWQQLAAAEGEGDAAGGGAGLASLYDACLPQENEEQQGAGGAAWAHPADAVETMKSACTWCCAIVEASDGNVLAILKALAVLQLAAAHAQQLQDSSSSAAAQQQQQQEAALTDLLPRLHACVTLLAGVVSHAPLQALRAQAALGLQQLLQGLPSAVRHACLQQLLSSGSAVEQGAGTHPEVAALLMQEVRLQLASSGGASGGGCFGPDACIHLVLPWLQQQGPVGWCDADTLPDRANAVCAALAVVRLALLRGGQASAGLQPQLLSALSAAVAGALVQLQAANSVEAVAQQQQQQQDGAGGSAGRQRIPGEASGAGQAVDAWLAVSRVQDVLDRVLELLVC